MTRRNHSLDTLRALAIVLVVNAHAALAYGAQPYFSAMQLGGLGVDLFFVLSGWLLGHQLLTEIKDTGTLEIGRFWYRRWLRTLPAYYAVLFLTYAWQIFGRSNYDLEWSYLFFGQNYLSTFPYFSASWSLCVEEHFYLLVAPLLFLCSRYPRTRILLVAVLIVPTLSRAFGWGAGHYQTHARYDQCAAGALLAYVDVFLPRLWCQLTRIASGLALIGAAAMCCNVYARFHPESEIGDLGLTVRTAVFGSFVLLASSGSFWKSRARLPGARYLADRAYSIYLLHGEALALARHFTDLPFILHLLIVWAFSLALAEILYRFVERPFLRARELFAGTRSREKPLADAKMGVACTESNMPRPESNMPRPESTGVGMTPLVRQID